MEFLSSQRPRLHVMDEVKTLSWGINVTNGCSTEALTNEWCQNKGVRLVQRESASSVGGVLHIYASLVSLVPLLLSYITHATPVAIYILYHLSADAVFYFSLGGLVRSSSPLHLLYPSISHPLRCRPAPSLASSNEDARSALPPRRRPDVCRRYCTSCTSAPTVR